MSQRDPSDSDSESLDVIPDTPLCIICEEAAAGVGPFSHHHLCQEHLAIDVADVWKLKRDVKEELRPYSEVSERVRPEALAEEQRKLSRQLKEIEEKLSAVQQLLDEFKARVTGQLRARQEAVQTCLRDCSDIVSYEKEVWEAEASGNMAEVCQLCMSMQVSVRDMQEDFERAERLRVESFGAELRSLRQLQRMVDSLLGCVDTTDAAVTARPETCDAGVTACDAARGDSTSDQRAIRVGGLSAAVSGAVAKACSSIVRCHEVKLDNFVNWVAVCSDTSGFLGDPSGRVVPAESAGDGSVPLPQSCLIARVGGNHDHLLVLSLDGTLRLRSHCDINWKENISGLHCDRQLLFIAQSDSVTVTDLSGGMRHKIRPDIAGFGRIGGIGGNTASVFVSSGNQIAAFSKSSRKLQTIITLSQLPDSHLCNLAIHGNCILVTDREHSQVHRVCIGTQQLVASHPTQRADLNRFAGPYGVAVDSRGRVFVSEFYGHSVRAVAADDGSLLWTLGVPGKCGSGYDKLNGVCGLAVVTRGPCEQLVVADCYNSRLLVLNLY